MLNECLEFYSRLLVQEEYLIDDVGRASLWPLVHVRLSKHLRNCLDGSTLPDGLEEGATTKSCVGLSAGEVCTLLTANGRFDWERTTKWFVCIQMLMDYIFMGTSAVQSSCCSDEDVACHQTDHWLTTALSLLSEIEVTDLAVVEHLSILCLDMSLQAAKMWKFSKLIESMHAAGDLLILVSISVGTFCGHPLAVKSDEVVSAAEQRLKQILERVEATDDDEEFREDIRKGIPLVLYLFNYCDHHEHPILQRMESLMAPSPMPIPAVGVTSGVLDEVEKFSKSSTLSWQGRYELLVRIQFRLEFFERRRKCRSFEELGEILDILFKWLAEDLKTDASWINETRRSCRHRVVEILTGLLESCQQQRPPTISDLWEVPLYDLQPELLLEDEETVVELFGLLCRTWALEISATSASPVSFACSPMKRVDDELPGSYEILRDRGQLSLGPEMRVYASEHYVDLIARISQAVGSGVMPLGRSRTMEMEDLLEQLVIVSFSGVSQGLPLFLDDSIYQPPDAYTRRGLSRRRKAALRYLEVTSSSDTPEKNTEKITTERIGYSETYRKSNLGFMPCHISAKLSVSLFSLVDRCHVTACRLLSHVKSETDYDILTSAVQHWLQIRVTQISTSLVYNWISLCLSYSPVDVLSKRTNLSKRIELPEHGIHPKVWCREDGGEDPGSSPSSWSSVTGSASRSIAFTPKSLEPSSDIAASVTGEVKWVISPADENRSVPNSPAAHTPHKLPPSRGLQGRLAPPTALLHDICASLDAVKLAMDLNPEFEMRKQWNEFRSALMQLTTQIDAIQELCPGAGLLTPALRQVLTTSVILMKNPRIPFGECASAADDRQAAEKYAEDDQDASCAGGYDYSEANPRKAACSGEVRACGELDMLQAMVNNLIDLDVDDEEDEDDNSDVSPTAQSILDLVDYDHKDPYAIRPYGTRPSRRGRIMDGGGLHEDLLQYVKGYFWDDRLQED